MSKERVEVQTSNTRNTDFSEILRSEPWQVWRRLLRQEASRRQGPLKVLCVVDNALYRKCIRALMYSGKEAPDGKRLSNVFCVVTFSFYFFCRRQGALRSLYLMTLYRKFTGALTFQNFYQASGFGTPTLNRFFLFFFQLGH